MCTAFQVFCNQNILKQNKDFPWCRSRGKKRHVYSKARKQKNWIPACPWLRTSSFRILLIWGSYMLDLVYFSRFSRQMTCLSSCPPGKWERKVTCAARKPTCPGQPNGTFCEPCRRGVQAVEHTRNCSSSRTYPLTRPYLPGSHDHLITVLSLQFMNVPLASQLQL